MRDGIREVCYWLGQEYWGKGIATAALKAFLLEDKIRPFYAGVAADNIPSIKVLEKCGFVRIREDNWSNRSGEEIKGFLFRLDGARNPDH